MLHDFSNQNSILQELNAFIRDKDRQGNPELFRLAVSKIGFILGYELSKTLIYKKSSVNTPLGKATTSEVSNPPVIATILRAGLPLQAGVLQAFPNSTNCFIGAYRKHSADGSFTIQLDYLATPNLDQKILIVTDPMLATGASLIQTLSELYKKYTPLETHVVSVIASTEGIKNLEDRYPKTNIWVASVDNQLDQHGYIVPGLGDAGDLSFGETEAR